MMSLMKLLQRYLPILDLGAPIALAAIVGLLLPALGLLRLGFLANFLRHPVISGFTTASGIQIAAGQAEGGGA